MRGERRHRRLERSQEIRRGDGGGHGLGPQIGECRLKRERVQLARHAAHVGARCCGGASAEGDGFVGQADGVGGRPASMTRRTSSCWTV